MIGSTTMFNLLLSQASELHAKKSHDYASEGNPYGNYHFAGQMGQLFDDCRDAGFVARMGEKLYRLANLENDGKVPKNESVEDTEIDLIVIMVLWMSDRRERRERIKLLPLKKGIITNIEIPEGY